MVKDYLYKILTIDEFKTFKAQGSFEGAPIDRQDGFIHFSFASQTQETLEKHFSGRGDLYIVEVDSKALLPSQYKLEPSRGGALFPHYYDHLKWSSVGRYWLIPMHDDGSYNIAVVDPLTPFLKQAFNREI